MNIITCTPSEARAITRAAMPRIGLRSAWLGASIGATEMAVETDFGVEASGFF